MLEIYFKKEDLKDKIFQNRFYVFEFETSNKRRCNRTTKVFAQKKDLSLIEIGESHNNSASWAGHTHEANKIIHKAFNYKLKNDSFYDGFIRDDIQIIKPYLVV